MAGDFTFPQGKANTIEAVKEYIKTRIDAGFAIGGATQIWRPWGEFTQGLSGAGSVMLSDIVVEGLGNYDKTKGFPTRGGSIGWDEYKLRYDRAGSYNIDRIDIFQVALAGILDKWTGQLSRNQLIPERDKINIMAAYERIKGAAPGNVEEYEPTVDDIIGKFGEVLNKLFNKTGMLQGYQVLVNGDYMDTFMKSKEVTKVVGVAQNPILAIEQRVGAVSGSILQWVPADRMKTEFDIMDGVTDGQEEGGVKEGDDAADIVAIFSAPDTIQSVDAVDVVNVFGPDQNQTADATRINMRFFYDTLITKNSLPGTYVLVAPGD